MDIVSHDFRRHLIEM